MSAEGERPIEADGEAPRKALASRLGYAGIVPLAVLTVWLAGIPVDHVWRDMTIRLLTTYAALVLTFLGGIRWGAALVAGRARTRRDIAIAVVPALIGWIVLFLPPAYAFVLLAVAFAALGAWDALSGQAGTLPSWFARLRMQLTAMAVIAMIVAFAATAAG